MTAQSELPAFDAVTRTGMEFVVACQLGLLHLAMDGHLPIDADVRALAEQERSELMVTFLLADGVINHGEEPWYAVARGTTGEQFRARHEAEPGAWACMPTKLLAQLARRRPQEAAVYAECAISLARAVIEVDDDVDPAELDLLARFESMLGVAIAEGAA